MNTIEAVWDTQEPDNNNYNKFIEMIREVSRLTQNELDTNTWIITSTETKRKY